MTNPGAQAMLDQMADAIDLARYQHPDHSRERPRPFSEADRSDREYAMRLARAALRALSAVQGEPVAWQTRVMYDKGSIREDEWCNWHDCTKAWFAKTNADIANGVKRIETRALFAHPAIGTPDNARVREALERAMPYVRPSHGGDIQADADLRFIHEALAALSPEQDVAKTMREALISAKCTSPDGTYVQASMDEVLAVVVHSRPHQGGGK